jgi:hypothetical protein
VYPLYLGETIHWANNTVDVEGSFRQLFRIGDDHPDYAPSLFFMLKASCRINDFIAPRLGVQYIINSLAWETETDMRFNKNLDWEDCTKDTGGLGLMAGVEFRIPGGTLNTIEAGYSLKADTSKNAAADRRNSTLDHAIYAVLKVCF